MSADHHSIQEQLDVIVRAAMKREYDKGGTITNATAFSAAVKRREVDNEAAVPGTLRLAFNAALKLLDEDHPHHVLPEAYSAWEPIEDDYESCSPEEKTRWLELINQKLAGLDFSFDRPAIDPDDEPIVARSDA